MKELDKYDLRLVGMKCYSYFEDYKNLCFRSGYLNILQNNLNFY